ncbi:DNA replication and repair protein RecF [subsurface metagenome]
MITELTIKNFRSIEDLTINLGAINFFIGPNNSGKSNIMKALSLCLGETYPSARSFNEKDFYNYDTTKTIVIKAKFNQPLTCNTAVYGFQLSFNGATNECDYFTTDDSGNILTYLGGWREIRVSNVMKSEVALMYLGLDRQASQQLRPNQWTLYGKLLRHIEGQIDAGKKSAFKTGVETSYATNIFPDISRMETILQSHIKQQTGLDLSLRLSVLDPMETIKNLRPYMKEPALTVEFDAEDMGAGTQSALAVAIAQAYNEIVRQPLVLAIEEPELYTHPHGCRHFYKKLKELSDASAQVICTTHERCFVNIADFESVHLVRKENGKTVVRSGINKVISSPGSLVLAAKFNEEINEVFFANHVILVEGSIDKIACQIALEKHGIDLDQQCASIIDCGSNSGVKPIAEVLNLSTLPQE